MTAPTVNVTCTAHDQNGNPVAGALFVARLDRTEIYDGFVVPEQFTGVANADGVCVLQLWPNALGVASSQYKISAVNPDDGRRFLNSLATIPNNDCFLHDVLALEPYPPIAASLQALNAAQAALAPVLEAAADAMGYRDEAFSSMNTAVAAAGSASASADSAADSESAVAASESVVLSAADAANLAAAAAADSAASAALIVSNGFSAALAAPTGSALMGFQQAGGVARTVEDKLSDIQRPRDFGATNNTLASLLAASVTVIDTGTPIETNEGYRYNVAAPAATDHHITTAGGVKLYVVPVAGSVSPRQFGASGDRSQIDQIPVQAAINFCSSNASRGTMLNIDGFFRCNGTLTCAGLLTMVAATASGNNNNTDKGVLAWDDAPLGTDAGLLITGQNWSISNVSFKGAARVKKILRLNAASVGLLQFCNISSPKNDDGADPGACIWGYGLIGVRIMDCWIHHPGYSRGIWVQEANKPSGSGIYYGFDNGSAVLRNRIYGNMANCRFDGGTFEFSGNDCEGALLLDTGKVIITGTSTKLIAIGNYAEMESVAATNPDGRPMIWFQNQGSGHSFTLIGNVGYTVPTREPGSICYDLGSVLGSYDDALIQNNASNRFESSFSLRGRTNAGFTIFEGNAQSFVSRTFAPTSYYSQANERTLSSLFPGRYGPVSSSAVGSHLVMDQSSRTEGTTTGNTWVSQSGSTIDLSAGNNVRYTGAASAELTYGGVVSSITVTNGGSGYTAAPNVTIAGNGVSGFSATATAVVVAGVVTAINLTSCGENYTAAPAVTISGGGGTGATAIAAVDLSMPVAFCGATYRLLNNSNGAITLKFGSGAAGTFRHTANPITVGSNQLAIFTVLPNRLVQVESIVG